MRAPRITCPFCGLACDDLTVAPTGVDPRGCARAAAGFARAGAPRRPHRVAGQAVDLATAVAAAAAILRQARAPLFDGLAADLHGIRALLALADATGGAVDHVNSAALLANAAVARASGWVAATFGEVANRADFILIVGRDPTRGFPRFIERLIDNPAPLYRDARPIVAVLGEAKDVPVGDPAHRIDVPPEGMLEALAGLAALLQVRPPLRVPSRPLVERLQPIAAGLAGARYGAVVWEAAGFKPDEAELAVELLAAITRRLNASTRCVGLPLGGGENGLGAFQAALWQTGWPLRLGFTSEGPQHDPWQFSARRLIASGEADALVWVAALAPTPAPSVDIPLIAIVADDVEPHPRAAVELRVGIPGLDHPGEIVRADTIVALPLQAAAPTDRPSVAEVARAIHAALGAAA